MSAVEMELHKSSPDNVLFSEYNIQSMMDQIYVSSSSHSRKGEMDPQTLAELWNIPLDATKRTLKSTIRFHYSEIHGGLTHRRRAGHGKCEHPRRLVIYQEGNNRSTSSTI